jgi:hypothetical protein
MGNRYFLLRQARAVPQMPRRLSNHLYMFYYFIIIILNFYVRMKMNMHQTQWYYTK